MIYKDSFFYYLLNIFWIWFNLLQMDPVSIFKLAESQNVVLLFLTQGSSKMWKQLNYSVKRIYKLIFCYLSQFLFIKAHNVFS